MTMSPLGRLEGTVLPSPVLDVSGLTISYRDQSGMRTAVHGIDFSVAPGEVVALVGESGSGKSSTAQAIIGLLLPDNGRLESGSIRLNRQEIAGWPQKRLDSIRGSVISLVPQDPGNSLNPVKTVGKQVAEILVIHGKASGAAADARAIELLERVGLNQPTLRAKQYPHELSGGMKQRVLIAIAIALKPSLIIADEPTSALDVTVQKHILDLIDELRREYGTAVLLVTHDLGVAADRADRLIVLKQGRIQEQGLTADLLANPQGAHTQRLLADAPSFNVRQHRIAAITKAAQAQGGLWTTSSSSKDWFRISALAARTRVFVPSMMRPSGFAAAPRMRWLANPVLARRPQSGPSRPFRHPPPAR